MDWVKNSKDKECIIEISREGCVACLYNGAIFNMLSLKLNDAGVKVPLFRIDFEN